MTLDGTNTWVLSAPGSRSAVVIDPGPDDEAHLDAVLAAVDARGARVTQTLLTHWHVDHSESARHFAELTGAPVRALDPEYRFGGEGLADGDEVTAGDLRLQVIATPGHTGDSLSFLLPDQGALLTGDTVLGRGTAVIAPPDGRLGPYLESLRRLREVCADGELRLLLPGHGPVLDQPAGVLDYYLKHREQRLEQVRAALAAGDETARQIVERVYADVDPILWPAAEHSVQAQLDYLNEA